MIDFFTDKNISLFLILWQGGLMGRISLRSIGNATEISMICGRKERERDRSSKVNQSSAIIVKSDIS